MIINKNYIVKWNSASKNHFVSLGYQYTKCGDEFEVNVFDLPQRSNFLIDVQCDYCENKIFQIPYCKAKNTQKHFCKENNKCEQAFKQDVINRRIATCKKKYGGNSPACNKKVQEKMQETCLKKYGTKNYSQCEEGRKKISENSKKNAKKSHEKSKETMLKKYGVENVFQLESIKEKIRQTNLKNTGYEYPSQCPEIREKAKETWIKNWGVDNPLKNKEIREKSMKTLIDQSHGTGINTSKQQEFIWLEIGGELNYKISNFHTDIAFPNELIVVEYDGGGHFLYKDINHESDDYFKELEQKREKFLFDSNWKIIRVVDRKSHARNFKQVLYNVKENVDYAKNILKNSDCQKIIINYDDKKIYYDNKEESILC